MWGLGKRNPQALRGELKNTLPLGTPGWRLWNLRFLPLSTHIYLTCKESGSEGDMPCSQPLGNPGAYSEEGRKRPHVQNLRFSSEN